MTAAAIDYASILAKAESQALDVLIARLRGELPTTWVTSYMASSDRPTNVLTFRHGTFDYIYDYYTELEIKLGGRVDGLEANVFLRLRSLNRGWSAEGKQFRAIEKYCGSNAGTFCFCRPMYADGTAQPAVIEFGVLRSIDDLWVERLATAEGCLLRIPRIDEGH